MNLNYVGSVAERFMKFRSSLATEEDVSENIFDNVSIYMPKSKAASNLAEGAYTPSEITSDSYAVVAVTVDNYSRVLKDTGDLLSQWLPVFNDGTNTSVVLYIVIFDDTEFTPELGTGSISWAPLTKAFKELYFISFFKTMFSSSYNKEDTNYIDLALCLAYQCELEATLSFCLTELKVTVFGEGGEDTNGCKVMSKTRGDETTHCTTLVGTDADDRAEYFWGYLNLIAPRRTELHIHNGSFMVPIILGKWFETKNSSGQFIGNKLAKIRLSGSKVKPTGLPSPLDSDVNLNLIPSVYEKLDEKNVGYFISISASSKNNAEFIRDRSIENFPITAYMISKWIDYQTSQDMANFVTDNITLTDPVLINEQTYSNIQSILIRNIQNFAGTGRITGLETKFPPLSEVKKGQSIEGVAVWSAIYVDDLESVTISGSVSF